MGKKSALAAGTAVAAGPSGLRRFAGGCLVIVLLAGLVLAGLVAVVAWMASRDGGFGGGDAGLPCPPQEVAVAYSPADTPQEVQEAVETALTDAGREFTEGGYGADSERDLVVTWWPTRDPGPPEASGRSTPSLRLEEVPTPEEVREALSDYLPACTATEPAEEAADESEDAPQASDDDEADVAQDDEGGAGGASWPWRGGSSPVPLIALLVVAWWVAGPQVISGVATALAVVLWPVRLGWRRLQRWTYRRRSRAEDLTPAEWPLPTPPGQRWHEEPEAMHDRRTPHQQVADSEPERRAALRERVREQCLQGSAPGPVWVWRLIYRVPKPGSAEAVGASKKNGVST